MRKPIFYPFIACALTAFGVSQAQEPPDGPSGPFPPDQWPASADPAKVVHYFSVGDAFAPLGDNWITGNMSILTGGDHNTAPISIGGYDGVRAVENYINIADADYPEWADDEEIDILMQVYGDSALLSPSGEPRDFTFLIGTLPEIASPAGGQLPVEARNRLWNWVLFRIPNTVRESDGTLRVGSIPANAVGATQAGGVNGGTIRMQGVPNLIVRAVAFGEKGAFGEPEQVNVFAQPEICAPEPETNLAWIDLASNQSEHMEVINSGDQTVTIDVNGPEHDRRTSVRPNGLYMNFGVTENFLGAPCNDAKNVKICVEYYDDPAYAGFRFGPEAFATDDKGSIGFAPEDQWHTLAGTGTWQQRSWTVQAVSLFGVNAEQFTAGPRFIFEGGAQIPISKFSLGIFRTGTHPLAGQDPLPLCFSDPELCDGVYGNFAEMDLALGINDGLAPGASGGDQEMIQDEAGPENDRRMAIRPAHNDGSPQHAHSLLNFAIIDEKLGPTSQPGAHLAICVTYYDDPALAGATFRPEVYISDRGGVTGFAFTSENIAVTLEGTGTWRDAYFELQNVKFSGVNQGPQAAARFSVSDKVYFSRVRYGVIRPCGPEAGVNPLAECKPPPDVEIAAAWGADGTIRLTWPAAGPFQLQETTDVADPASWTAVTTEPVVEGDDNVVTVTPSGQKYFRLIRTE